MDKARLIRSAHPPIGPPAATLSTGTVVCRPMEGAAHGHEPGGTCGRGPEQRAGTGHSDGSRRCSRQRPEGRGPQGHPAGIIAATCKAGEVISVRVLARASGCQPRGPGADAAAWAGRGSPSRSGTRAPGSDAVRPGPARRSWRFGSCSRGPAVVAARWASARRPARALRRARCSARRVRHQRRCHQPSWRPTGTPPLPAPRARQPAAGRHGGAAARPGPPLRHSPPRGAALAQRFRRGARADPAEHHRRRRGEPGSSSAATSGTPRRISAGPGLTMRRRRPR